MKEVSLAQNFAKQTDQAGKQKEKRRKQKEKGPLLPLLL